VGQIAVGYGGASERDADDDGLVAPGRIVLDAAAEFLNVVVTP